MMIYRTAVLLRSLHTQVMGTIPFDFWSNGGYPLVAAVALMAAVTTVGVILALLIGGANSFASL